MTEVEKKGRIKVQHGKLNGKDIKITGELALQTLQSNTYPEVFTEVSPILEVPVAQLKRGLSRVLFK
jgi:DNA polymerase III sliding clamp (beta) subunit (PCNA family)